MASLDIWNAILIALYLLYFNQNSFSIRLISLTKLLHFILLIGTHFKVEYRN